MPKPHDSYDYQYDSDDPYVYAGTCVLVNKFGLREYEELSEVERNISGAAAARLEEQPIEGCFDLAHLGAIHKALFGEIYAWAGTVRQKGFIAKGRSLFCAAEYIEPYSDDLFSKLQSEDYLRNLGREMFCKRLAFYISEINALHPFREGNGRTQRIFARQLARQAGWDLNYVAASPEELCDANVASMTDCGPLEALLLRTVKPLNEGQNGDTLRS